MSLPDQHAFSEEIILPSGRKLGSGNKCFIVAELSGNHNGSYERALKLISKAKEAGADAVKLQTYTADTLTIDCDRPEFIVDESSIWKHRKLYDLYREAQTPWEWHEALFAAAGSIGLEFFSTPFDVTAVEFLEKLDTPLYKIASFEIVDMELLRRVAATGKPVIMSTGMASDSEIADAVEVFCEKRNRQLILLKCISAYPASVSDMNVATLSALIDRFRTLAGISDHSLSNAPCLAAVALGACVVEKHLTLDRRDGGVDAAFSLEPHEFSCMAKAIREIEDALGEAQLGPGLCETSSIYFRRSIFAVNDIPKGAKLTRDNVRVIRPGHGLPPKDLPKVLKSRALLPIARGTPLSWDIVSSH